MRSIRLRVIVPSFYEEVQSCSYSTEYKTDDAEDDEIGIAEHALLEQVIRRHQREDENGPPEFQPFSLCHLRHNLLHRGRLSRGEISRSLTDSDR